jgi:hypothetical protein
MRNVRGKAIDGSNVKMLFGRFEIPCLSRELGDAIETEVVHNMGSQSQDGRTEGTYKTDQVKVKMERKIYSTLYAPKLAVDGAGHECVNITFQYKHPDLGDDSDFVEGCRLVGTHDAGESGKADEVELTFDCIQIYWTDKRITINKRNLTQGYAASNF